MTPNTFYVLHRQLRRLLYPHSSREQRITAADLATAVTNMTSTGAAVCLALGLRKPLVLVPPDLGAEASSTVMMKADFPWCIASAVSYKRKALMPSSDGSSLRPDTSASRSSGTPLPVCVILKQKNKDRHRTKIGTPLRPKTVTIYNFIHESTGKEVQHHHISLDPWYWDSELLCPPEKFSGAANRRGVSESALCVFSCTRFSDSHSLPTQMANTSIEN